MFLRREDVINRFAENFRETEDGGVVFQPPRAKVGLPITWDCYDACLAKFERQHMVNMAAMWIIIMGSGIYGLYQSLLRENILILVGAAFAGFLLSSLMHFRDYLGILRPLIDARADLEKRHNQQINTHP